MIIKTFEGASVADAMKSVKSEFGPNAIILSTKESNEDDTQKRHYAIKAASSEKDCDNKADKQQRPLSHYAPQNNGGDNILKTLNMIYDSVSKNKKLSELEGKINNLSSVSIEILNSLEDKFSENTPIQLKTLYNKLAIEGIEKKHLSDLIENLKKLKADNLTSSTENSVSDYFLAQTIKWFNSKTKVIKLTPSNSKIHFIVGPPGSGKSSLTTKLAVQNLKEGKKILIVAFDSRGVPQHNNIKSFAKILDLPLVCASSSRELIETLYSNQNYDFIYIDNVGGFPFTDQEEKEIKHFSLTESPIDFHITLPLTAKTNQNDLLIRKYSTFGITSLAFSHLDNALSWGDIFNLSVKWTIPLSFFLTGPEIPEDFEYASKERLIGKIFGI